MNRILPSRRALIGGMAVGSGVLLSGCDGNSDFIRSVDPLNEGLHRLLGGSRGALAREFDYADRSPVFKMNGSTMPGSPAYQQHLAENFANWRLVVDGLVARPLNLSLSDLAAMPSRSQVTRHDCVEGWSAIGEWTGTPLAAILRMAGMRDGARYVVFHCADDFDGNPYYESIDLVDAFHTQTILAWGMNRGRLPVGHGAPLRLRVERQLGYKQAKYVMRVELRDRLDNLYLGKGGYWEDHHAYQWYAGI
jgi:DMSO/TMAO reductase YedYZ molybdopterin-dependent catalytic subunit